MAGTIRGGCATRVAINASSDSTTGGSEDGCRGGGTDEWRPALHELDASAVSIRAAIAENPRSRYLLGQLQRTYALRLQLTQQAVFSAGLPT